jgi:hypothetical protein
MNTYTSFCIAGCLFMIFVSMAIGFVNLSGAFPTTLSTNPNTGNITNMTNGGYVGSPSKLDMGTIWLVGMGSSIGAALAIGILMKSTNMLAVSLFGGVFWSSWLNILGVVYVGGFDFMSSPGYIALIGMLTVGMTFMFIGAIIGMLSGSIWMR